MKGSGGSDILLGYTWFDFECENDLTALRASVSFSMSDYFVLHKAQGGPSQSILMDFFSGRVIRLYVVGIMTTVSHSSPYSSPLLTFYPVSMGLKAVNIFENTIVTL